MKKRNFMVLVGIMGLFLTGCSYSKSGTDATTTTSGETMPQQLNVGITAELTTADVSLAMDDVVTSVMRQVSEGLYAFDEKGGAIPALAQEVVEPTDDGLTYTIKLKEGVKWSNGDPITAHDFEYSWKRTVDPATASPQAYYFEGIANYTDIASGAKDPDELGVTALDDQTLEVHLAYPMSYFPQMMAVVAFYPLNEAFVEEKGDAYGTTSDDTLYNGPYVLKDWNGSSMSWNYEKNPEYWDADNVAIPNVNVQVIKENVTGKNLFDTGELDVVKISGDIVANEKNNEALQIRSLPGTYFLKMNTQNEVLGNNDVRKAIALSIDSESLANSVLNDGSKKSIGFVPTGFPNPETGKDFTEEIGDINPYDPDQAKELWEKAKTDLGIDGAKLEILCSDTESAKKLSEFVQGSLTSTLDGMEVTVAAVPFNNRLERSRGGDFDMVVGGWTPVYADPVDFLNLLQTGNNGNDGKWSNAKYDQLIEDAHVTYANDVEKRWAAMQEADKIISEEAPLASLYQISEAYLVNPDVKGLQFGPLGSIEYKYASFK